jgi:RNA polymerase sigma-70 factor (ECF subfamily)
MPPAEVAAALAGRPARVDSAGVSSAELDFQAVYEQHFDFVWRSLRRLGVSRAAIDDVTQEVFIVVVRRLADYDGRASVRSWLFGITYRSFLGHVRRERRRGGHLPLPETLPCPEPGPFDQVRRAEAVRFVEAFLATLDADKRAVFILADLEQMTAPEISVALGVKLNTVYSRLRAGRAAFHQAVALEQRGES